MKATVQNDQTGFRLPTKPLAQLTKWLQQKANRLHKASAPSSIILILTDDVGIQDVHLQCFGTAVATDVISLNYASVPGETNSGIDGEIFVNVACAVRSGNLRAGHKGREWCAVRELALYIAHGCDHLAGGRDDTPEGRIRMRRRELRWVSDACRQGLLDFTLTPVAGTSPQARTGDRT